MPTFIRTKKQEELWNKAKEAANMSHSENEGDTYWGLVNHIYQRMNKVEVMKGVFEKLNKQGGGDDEENEIQDYGNVEEDPEDLQAAGMHEFDPYEENSDDADAWLRENDPEAKGSEVSEESEPETEVENVEESPKKKEEEVKPKSKSKYAEWAPRTDYSDDENNAIKGFMDQGYSHREAERMANAYKGPTNFQDALSHPVKPSQMSEKMVGELKEIAKHWLDRADRQSKMTADPEKNPVKFASGKLMQAHEDATKDYSKAYNDFLGSDELKNKRGLDRHKAIQAWKQQWKESNPDYQKNLSNVSGAQKHFKEAKDAYGKNIHDKLMHIITGGMGEDPSSRMSAEEAAQHVGGAKAEEGGHQASIVKDPSATFAAANQQFIEHAKGQSTYTRGPKTRLQSVQEQMNQPTATKPPVDTAAAHKVIVRRANPEQMDRFKRATSARTTLGVGSKPEGEK